MTFFWLADDEVTGQCSKNLVLSPKSPCSSWRPRRKNSDPAPRMHFCLLTLPLFLHPFPWLATVWTSPLELREDQEGWMKPISYKKETRNMKRTPLHQQCPSQFCKGHNIITWNLDLPLGKWHNPAKKGRGKDGLLTASKEKYCGGEQWGRRIFPKQCSPEQQSWGSFKPKVPCIFMKGLRERKIQHRIGAKVNRVQALDDWSHKDQKCQHH